mmetsp:Transcript_23296/g.67216  ORF Transcript_23296/g.67216 Transcript_23296/m.67216 type:complete len:387 (-) Transcript_23296:28-1188(-)
MGEAVKTTFVKQTDINGDGNLNNDYTYTSKTGTSIAVPAVAASAALLWSHFPECANHQIRTALARTAWNPNGCDDRLGFGIVQAKDAYDLLSRRGCELDGQIFAGATSACDGYATLTPTASPTISAAPTQHPTAAPTDLLPPKPSATNGFDWWVFLILAVGAILIGYALYVVFTQLILPRYCSKEKSDAERRESNNRRSSSRRSSTGRSCTIDDHVRKSSVAKISTNNEDDIHRSSAVRNSTRASNINGDGHRRSSNHRCSTRSSTQKSTRQSSSSASPRESVRQNRRKSSIAGSNSTRRSSSAGRRSTTSDGPRQSTLHSSTVSTRQNDSMSIRSSAGDGPRQSSLHSSTASTRRSDSISPKENNTQVKKSFQGEEKPDWLDLDV